ncbi:YoaK family protein [Psychrobacter sp. FDAARGOS_221]|uniref:YoaK family protein n=1 Tax=Psychrobacter sp. FDAARGOS_221 TaxID=1975705 RepID=UPI000BB5839F|nr:YoaK family protein [Psychrobacter sp. FDAARGOS_221]PNK60673.1 DUF1275 domain-containing protein [Psychrobacter sp. FDAARGOS_221]
MSDNTNTDENKPISEKPLWKRYEATILLTMVGGAINTIGFVALLGFFTNHVTGNLVMAGGGLVKDDKGLWIKLGALPVFILTVIITQRIINTRREGQPILSQLLFTEALFLTAFMISALAFGPFNTAGAIDVAITGFLGLMAFAIRNTASRGVMGKSRPTLLMTGNTTQLGIDLSDYVFNRTKCNMESLKYSSTVVLSFVFGAFIGAVFYLHTGFWSIAPFVVAVLYLAFKARDTEYLKQQNMYTK